MSTKICMKGPPISPFNWGVLCTCFPLSAPKSREPLRSRLHFLPHPENRDFLLGKRQRSGEGVVRRNGYPKGCFWRVRSFSAPLSFSGPFRCFKSKPRGGNGWKRTPQKHPFGQPSLRTTPSPLLSCSPMNLKAQDA